MLNDLATTKAVLLFGYVQSNMAEILLLPLRLLGSHLAHAVTK